jgi:hypothetical protein
MAAAGIKWVVKQTYSESNEDFLKAVEFLYELGQDVNAVCSLCWTSSALLWTSSATVRACWNLRSEINHTARRSALRRPVLRGKVCIDAIVERKFHAQSWVLLQDVLPHLSGIFGFAHIDIPVGDVFLHEIDR